jgi:hypothetical protein
VIPSARSSLDTIRPKERRLEPQITIGLLTDTSGFRLAISAFAGNMAEAKTMLPVIESFMTAHQLPDVTVVADAGVISEANQKTIEAAGLSFILGMKIPHALRGRPVAREHAGEQIPDAHVFTQPWPAGPNGGGRGQIIYYQYRHDPGPADAARNRRAGRQRGGRQSPGKCRSTEPIRGRFGSPSRVRGCTVTDTKKIEVAVLRCCTTRPDSQSFVREPNSVRHLFVLVQEDVDRG